MPVYSWLTQSELHERGWRLTPQQRPFYTFFKILPREHLSANLYHHLEMQGRNQPVHYLPHFEVDGSDGYSARTRVGRGT